MSNLSHNFDGDQQHPPQEDFLLFVDGELSQKETEQWESHLDACWSCRVRVAKIEETITDIIEFEETVSQYQTSRGSGSWGNFDSLLNAAAMEAAHIPFNARFFDFWKHLNLRFAAPAVAAVLIGVLVYQFVLVPPVSAAILLDRSIKAQEQLVGQTAEAVIHQRIRVRQKELGVTWEIWNDTANARVKQGVLPENIVRPQLAPVTKTEGKQAANKTDLMAESAKFDAEFVTSLRDVLRANGMNEHRPLSAASYKAWSDTISEKVEQVEEGKDTFTIKTTRTNPTAATQISEARLTLNSAYYHPTTLYIRTADQEFELSEQEYQIVSLKDVDPSVFADPTKVEVASTVGTQPKPEASTAPEDIVNVNIAIANTNTSPATASTTAEVEVLELLNKVGADISEQISVNRMADGRLLVEGLVESERRKAEILSALSPVRNNPAIRIKIQTIEEAAKALARQKAQATPGVVERVEVEAGGLPVDADLRQHFANRGGDTDEHIRAFASRVTSRSRAAGLQASALNRMVQRFNAAQLAELGAAARTKWLGILKGYAAAVRRETASLRSELNPVFGGFEASGGETISGDADLITSARRLYEITSANDRTVRSAFTVSAGGNASAVKSANFRRSIAQAEAIAAAIERAR